MSATTEKHHFEQLRAECVRLVHGWPATPNYAVGTGVSDDDRGSAAVSTAGLSAPVVSAQPVHGAGAGPVLELTPMPTPMMSTSTASSGSGSAGSPASAQPG